MDRAVGVLRQLKADAVECLWIRLQGRQVFLLDDRRWHIPGRIDRDELHFGTEHRRRQIRFADHDFRVPVDLVVIVERERVIRDVDDNMRIAQVARCPAPALHIHDDHVSRVSCARTCFPAFTVEHADRVRPEIAVDIDVVFGLESLNRIVNRIVIERVLFVARDVETLAQCGYAGIFHPRTDDLAIRHVHARQLGLFCDLGLRWRRSFAQFGELGPAPCQAKIAEKPELPRVHVPDGKIIRPGMKDARVTALRKRLDIAGDKENPLYDDAVRDAVKAFQTENDINVDGNLGPNTVRTLNGERQEVRRSSADPTDLIIVNMERWRWVPRDLGNPHVVVNIPDFTLTLFNNDKVYWHTKIVVGKPNLPTPMLSAEMKFITVNPTWNVPPSIIEKEYLPALQADPQALDRIGLKLTQDVDGTIHISQPPGAGNALGRIRFNFPNKFLFYQHDTPDKYLFSRDKRAFSHGCMRVQNPLTYGEKLLSLVLPKERFTEARLESMFGGSEININFPKFIPVHLTYQTAFVDDAGKLQLREDVYGRDAKMLAILKSNERKVADIAVERASPNSSSKPVRMPVGMYGSGGSYGGGGSNFFDWIFGGPQGGARPYPPRNVPPPARNNNGRYSWR